MIVKVAPFEDVFLVHCSIPEFCDSKYKNRDYFTKRYCDKVHLNLCVYEKNEPVGYSVWYEKEEDGSLYCWMVGVIPAFRRKGVLSLMMQFGEDWARKRGYSTLSIKTRNSRREMLSYLILHEYLVLEVEKWDTLIENRILLQKDL